MEPEHAEEEELLDGEETFVMPELEYTPVVANSRRRAMESLKNIVSTSGLRHDIKRVHNTESLRGATKWAKKHTTSKRHYTAAGEDIDGDGIEDVLVRTTDGQLVIVNGYTVRNSDYPYRQMFGNQPVDVRKKYGNYKRFLNEVVYGTPKHDPDTGRIIWPKQNPEEDPTYLRLKAKRFRTYKPREKTAYQLFTSEIVKPQIEEIFKNEPDKY